jgi:hypothetical protein
MTNVYKNVRNTPVSEGVESSTYSRGTPSGVAEFHDGSGKLGTLQNSSKEATAGAFFLLLPIRPNEHETLPELLPVGVHNFF